MRVIHEGGYVTGSADLRRDTSLRLTNSTGKALLLLLLQVLKLLCLLRIQLLLLNLGHDKVLVCREPVRSAVATRQG